MGNKRVQVDANEAGAGLVAGVTGTPPPTGVRGALLKRQAAKRALEAAKNPAAVALGRLGGLKGGKARAESLSSRERAEIASKAARKRWDLQRYRALGFNEEDVAILSLTTGKMTGQEIADAVGVSAAKVRQVINRARKLVRPPAREQRQYGSLRSSSTLSRAINSSISQT